MIFEEFEKQFKVGDRISFKKEHPTLIEFQGKKGFIFLIEKNRVSIKIDGYGDRVFISSSPSLEKFQPDYFKK